MTPEEKAASIIDKMRDLSEYPGMSACGKSLVLKHAKDCAIICVDEILQGLATGSFATTSTDAYEYWQQVKTEIESL